MYDRFNVFKQQVFDLPHGVKVNDSVLNELYFYIRQQKTLEMLCSILLDVKECSYTEIDWK